VAAVLRPPAVPGCEPDGVDGGRESVLAAVARRVPDGRRVRVAVDGRDGAGKTVFADELAGALRALGRPVLRASVDGFHHPRAVRYRRGRDSPAGYWLDAFDYDRLVTSLLEPFAAGRPVRTAVHDVRTDAALDLPPVPVPPSSVLLVDGVFVLRDELAAYWDVSIYLQVDLSVGLARMAARDGTGPEPDPRYVEAQRIYTAACDPAVRADLVVDNTDLAAPRMIISAR
jgi:uridine kinase